MDEKRDELVLIIEDNANLVFVLSKLVRQIGYEAVHSYNGKDGIKKALNTNIKLIILDIGLPDISGHSVIKQIRELTSKPIIVISYDKTIENQIKSFDSKANIFHQKPINYTLLTVQIKSLMEKKGSESKQRDVLKISNDIHFDTADCTVHIGDRVVTLSEREARFLNLLVQYEGKIVSRELISRKISPSGDSMLKTSINTMVCRLRAKLKLQNCDFIETIHTRGYSFKRPI